LARKQRHLINSSARTGTPGVNIKMSDHSMLGGAAPGENFIRPGLLDADERDKVRQMLSLEELYMVTRRAHLAEPRGDRWQLMFDDANL
jgi:hypothetical protein